MAKRKLEKDGVNINCKEKDTGNTAAHAAAKYDQLEVLRFLESSGFTFAATPEELADNEGNTPLHIASERMNFEVMLFLVMNGHPTTIKNKKGLKPGDNSMEVRMYY
jgi:ankyrin repeat protein